PLSARVKRGAFVALEVLTMHLAVPIAVVVASVTGLDRAFWKDKAKRRLALLAAVFGCQIAYATYVGGDAWEWMLYANRYTCVGMPALIVLVAVMLERAIAPGTDVKRVATRFGAALIVIGAVLVAVNLYAKWNPEHGI